jgi:hypothetical protein
MHQLRLVDATAQPAGIAEGRRGHQSWQSHLVSRVDGASFRTPGGRHLNPAANLGSTYCIQWGSSPDPGLTSMVQGITALSIALPILFWELERAFLYPDLRVQKKG